MCLISAKIVHARKEHQCDDNRACRIREGEPYLRLYGSAHHGDPKYVLKYCLRCLDGMSASPKIETALETAGIQFNVEGRDPSRPWTGHLKLTERGGA